MLTHKALVDKLAPGGHDHALVYQAYHEAVHYTGGPSVIIAQTIKGYNLPMAAHNFAHQQKKLSEEDLRAFGHALGIPHSDEALAHAEYYRENPPRSIQHQGAALPERTVNNAVVPTPTLEAMAPLFTTQGTLSTTTSYVRVLAFLLRVPGLKERIVPIVADEARTFGMEGMFKQIGVYQSIGSQFESHDLASLTGYRESAQGQLMQEGIDEAGAMATWMALATSYSVNHYALVPFYIFYSMFGFQRVMDLIWAAADSRARGFLLGATSGRTTLAGEGLQHADGHSVLLAQVVPHVVWYDPAWHYEVVVIMQYYLAQMLQEHRDVIVYMTLVNEAIEQKSMPEGIQHAIIQGMYGYAAHEGSVIHGTIRLLGSGALFHVALKVYTDLCSLGLSCAVYSVTSYGMLQRAYATQSVLDDALAHPEDTVVAVSDYVCLVPEMLRAHVAGDYTVCGTDGFGMSDTRAKLREHFGVDAQSIMHTVMRRLIAQQRVEMPTVQAWMDSLGYRRVE